MRPKIFIPLLLALVGSIASASPVLAGFLALSTYEPQNRYTVTITGGESTNYGDSGTHPYQTYTGTETPLGYSNNYHLSEYDIKHGGLSLGEDFASSEGELTITLQWHGPDPAPKSILLKEACFGGVSPSTFFDADNCFGDPIQGSYGGDFGMDWGNPRTSPPRPIPHYRVIKGGDTIVYTRNPYAWEYNAYLPWYGGGVSAEVYYALKITPISSDWMTLQGVSSDTASSDATVVGRRVTATVQLPNGYTATGPYAWNVPGSLSEFKVEPSSFPTGAVYSNATASLQGKTVPFSSPSAITANWFWWAPGTKQVEVAVPISYQEQPLGNVTISRSVEVYSPLSTLTAAFSRSTAEYYKVDDLKDYKYQDRIASRKDVEPPPGQPRIYAVEFTGTVNENTAGPTGGGEWAFVQLISTNTTRNVAGTSLTAPEATVPNTFGFSVPTPPSAPPLSIINLTRLGPISQIALPSREGHLPYRSRIPPTTTRPRRTNFHM